MHTSHRPLKTDRGRRSARWFAFLGAFAVSCALLVGGTPVLAAAAGFLDSGAALTKGMDLYSPDRRTMLSMQTDGNLVVYATDGHRALWASGTSGDAYVAMQGDGNLVVIAAGGRPLWASGTNGYAGAHLEVQNDGNVVVYDTAHVARWATNRFNPPQSEAARLASAILANRNITIRDSSENPSRDRADRSLASLQLQDIAAGKKASLSTRCAYAKQLPASIDPDVQILRFMSDLGNTKAYQVNVLFGQCHSGAGSLHHAGKAVDLTCGLDTGAADTVGARYGVKRNFETCPANAHWHYSVGGR